MHNEASVSVSRDRSFRSTPEIGHDQPKQPVTPYRNDRSRLSEMTGHDGPEYAIERLLKSSSLSLADVYPTRGSKGAKGPKSVVAPKYRNPENGTQTWSGRGKRPLWFVQALKKRGVTAESLLIDGAPKAAPAKTVRKGAVKKVAKTAAKKVA